MIEIAVRRRSKFREREISTKSTFNHHEIISGWTTSKAEEMVKKEKNQLCDRIMIVIGYP